METFVSDLAEAALLLNPGQLAITPVRDGLAGDFAEALDGWLPDVHAKALPDGRVAVSRDYRIAAG